MHLRSIVIGALVAFILWFFFIPTLAFGFLGWMACLLAGAIVTWMLDQLVDDDNGIVGSIFAPIIILSLMFFGYVFSSWGLFEAKSYRELLGNVESKEVNSLMSPISAENVAIVDVETAHRLADKVLGTSDKMLGSQVDIGPLELQKVKDKLYYVAPLLHSGFFKWMDNGKEGTNGYIMVSAINEKDVHLVQAVNGRPVRIVYQPEAFMGQDLERHTYFSGHATVGMTEFSFEIDDDGKPYYVISLYDNKVGFEGEDVVGVCLVDVETGETTDYSVDEAPQWVDRIQPHQFVDTQIDDWGYFVNGWMNPSNDGRVQTTEGMSLVYGDDGRCYFYTGICSVGNNQSSIGFMMVDSRNKHVTYYKQAGATEEAAMGSAEGKMSDKRYRASYPRPYNIDGKWTYVMAMKDDEGLIKGVAMVSVTNYEIVGVGDDVRSAMRDYNKEWNSKGNAVSFTPQGATYNFSGVVERISKDIRSGDTYYYFTIRGDKDKGFVVTSSVSEEAVLTAVGDSIKVAFDDAENPFIDVQFFDNLNMTPKKTSGQERVEKYFKQVDDRNDSTQARRDDRSLMQSVEPAVVHTKNVQQ